MAVSAIHDITDANHDGKPDNMSFHMWVLNYSIYQLGGERSLTDTLPFTFRALSMVGLFLIALGTGGIKPCVAAFGGDQFSVQQVGIWPHFCPGSCAHRLNSCWFFLPMQERQRSTFFSVFYLCINGGSLLSTIITPILRGEWNRNFNNLSDLMGGLNLLFCVCVHLQLRNAASTRNRSVILWLLVFQQRWWWSLWVCLKSFKALNK